MVASLRAGFAGAVHIAAAVNVDQQAIAVLRRDDGRREHERFDAVDRHRLDFDFERFAHRGQAALHGGFGGFGDLRFPFFGRFRTARSSSGLIGAPMIFCICGLTVVGHRQRARRHFDARTACLVRWRWAR